MDKEEDSPPPAEGQSSQPPSGGQENQGAISKILTSVTELIKQVIFYTCYLKHWHFLCNDNLLSTLNFNQYVSWLHTLKSSVTNKICSNYSWFTGKLLLQFLSRNISNFYPVLVSIFHHLLCFSHIYRKSSRMPLRSVIKVSNGSKMYFSLNKLTKLR